MAVTYLDDNNFDEEVTNSDLPVIIDFWAPWCGPCKTMGPTFKKLSEDYDGELKFAKLNIDDYPSIAQQYNISSIPSLVVTKDGKEVDRIVGVAPKKTLKKNIDDILDAM